MCFVADLKGSDATAHQSTVKLVALKGQLAALHTLLSRLGSNTGFLRLTRSCRPSSAASAGEESHDLEATTVASVRHCFNELSGFLACSVTLNALAWPISP